jgi:hypothetical protein
VERTPTRTLQIADQLAKAYPEVHRHVISDVVMSTLDHPLNVAPATERIARSQELAWVVMDRLNHSDLSGAKNAMFALLATLEEID